MNTVLLLIHLFVTLALIGVVLIQRSEGGGLGIGTSQGMGGFMSGRGTTNLLTRATAILGTAFFLLSPRPSAPQPRHRRRRPFPARQSSPFVRRRLEQRARDSGNPDRALRANRQLSIDRHAI